MLAHLQSYYRWNARLSTSNYISLFDEFTARYRAMPQYDSSTVIDWYVNRVRPHIREHPTPWRNFIGLNSISPDALVILGLIGLPVLSWRDWRLAVILSMLIAPVYLSVGRRWDDKAKRWQFKRWTFNDDKEHQIRKLTF